MGAAEDQASPVPGDYTASESPGNATDHGAFVFLICSGSYQLYISASLQRFLENSNFVEIVALVYHEVMTNLCVRHRVELSNCKHLRAWLLCSL